MWFHNNTQNFTHPPTHTYSLNYNALTLTQAPIIQTNRQRHKRHAQELAQDKKLSQTHLQARTHTNTHAQGHKETHGQYRWKRLSLTTWTVAKPHQIGFGCRGLTKVVIHKTRFSYHLIGNENFLSVSSTVFLSVFRTVYVQKICILAKRTVASKCLRCWTLSVYCYTDVYVWVRVYLDAYMREWEAMIVNNTAHQFTSNEFKS